MELRARPLDERPLADAVGALNAGFKDYVIKAHIDIPAFLRMIRQDQIDCSLSRIVEDGVLDVGIALIARRGWRSRLAAMAVIPQARGQGVGAWLVDLLLHEAESRGDRAMELEVIEGNAPAVALYQSRGFERKRRLLSFQARSKGGKPEARLQEVDIRRVANLVALHGLADLPWQISGESLSQAGPPNRAYQQDGSYIVLSDPEKEGIVIRALITEPGRRGQGSAARLLRGVMEGHPDKAWTVPALCPQEFEPLFLKAGFQHGPISQLQMDRQLS